MKLLTICLQVFILYIFSYIGKVITNTFQLIIPGSIVGLILLFICLCLNIIPEKVIENGASFLLSILILLFIPTAVGIMNYPSLLSVEGLLLFATVLISTGITIGITGKTNQFFEKRSKKRKDEKECTKHCSHSS